MFCFEHCIASAYMKDFNVKPFTVFIGLLLLSGFLLASVAALDFLAPGGLKKLLMSYEKKTRKGNTNNTPQTTLCVFCTNWGIFISIQFIYLS